MLFTVAITVRKRQYFLPHAIQSVLNQTHRDWEIVVYSFGRCRKSRDLVAWLEGEIPIRYVRGRARHRTRGNNLRRRAIEEARGSYVVILGHDNLLYPTYLETMAALVGSDPDALPVVPVDFWKELERRGTYPTTDPVTAGVGEIDLLNFALPVEVSRRLGCFGGEMEYRRQADFLSFDILRQEVAPRFAEGPTRACHF